MSRNFSGTTSLTLTGPGLPPCMAQDSECERLERKPGKHSVLVMGCPWMSHGVPFAIFCCSELTRVLPDLMRRTQRTHPLLGAGQVLEEHRGLEIPSQRPSLEAAVCHGRSLVCVACHRVPNVHGGRHARPFPCLLSYHPHGRRNHPQFAKGQDDNPIQCHCKPGALPWHCQHWGRVILWGGRSWHSVAPSSIPGPHSLNARTPSHGNCECPPISPSVPWEADLPGEDCPVELRAARPPATQRNVLTSSHCHFREHECGVGG